MEFSVFLIIIEGKNRNPIIQLEAKRVDMVIDNRDLMEVSVSEYPQILHIYLLSGLDAVFTVEAIVNELMVRV